MFVSAEWLRTLATGLPILVAAWWILRGQAWLWRRWIWQEAGGTIRQTAEALGGTVVPLATGWRVEASGRRIDWVGGVRGVRTVVDGETREGLATEI